MRGEKASSINIDISSKPMCAVKTNMSKILSEKIDPKWLCRVLFYISILFSVCGGAVALSQINLSGSGLHIIT